MSYGKTGQSRYGKKAPTLRRSLNQISMHHTPPSANQQLEDEYRSIQSNLSGTTLFLAKFLSGVNNIIISPTKGSSGYSVERKQMTNGGIIYNIRVPHWGTYTLPLPDKDKYRIYRNGVWHESMHIKYTPEEVYGFGVDATKDPSSAEAFKQPLAHDMINIIEDRRIEDLGEIDWEGTKDERLFANAYAFTRRMDVGEFYSQFLKQYFDPQKGQYVFPDKSVESAVKRRIAHMRHEAFLQRLLVKKIKGFDQLPKYEYEIINGEAKKVEAALKTLETLKDSDYDGRHKIYLSLANLSLKVIENLALKDYTPKLTRFGESSWDQSFQSTDVKPGDVSKTRAGIDDYFDEITAIEVICASCGKHYTKKLGVRV